MEAQAQTVDTAAFGVIYGTITVLSLLMALHTPIEAPLGTAAVLFGSVLAVTLAKAYAEVCEHMLAERRAAHSADLVAAWRHSRPVLLAANAPAACFLIAGAGVWPADTAFVMAQITALASLVYFGGRIGWRIRTTVTSVLAGAGVTAFIGVVISSLKYLAH